jgi:hypothetical protein
VLDILNSGAVLPDVILENLFEVFNLLLFNRLLQSSLH